MKFLRSLCLLPLFTHPIVSVAYNETGEALPLETTHYNNALPNANWWVNLGVGVGSSFNTGRTSELNGKVSSQLSFNGRLSPHTALTFYSNALGSDSDARDSGILYGYVNRKPNWYYSASAGICYTRIDIKTDWTISDGWLYRDNAYWSSSVGIPLQVQTFWTPFRHFGIGLIGHGVVSKDPYINALLAIQFYA